MLQQFLSHFDLGLGPVNLDGQTLCIGQRAVPVRDGIPRFTPDLSYSSGNFSLLRERHAILQLDSKNGTHDRLNTLLERTQWPRSFFAGKTVLECGCGAGPDTEVLLSLGAKVVAVDIAGLDTARRNLGDRENLCLVQANIADMPLAPGVFDIVFCHRVLQHTPSPSTTLNSILRHLKPGGAAFVHSYSCEALQLLRWKYALRPITRRMNSERLYRMVESYAPALYRLTSAMDGTALGRLASWTFVPFLNYRRKPKFASWSAEALIEYGVHDTFDALSPRYDRPMPRWRMKQIARRHLRRPFEVVNMSMVNILRSTQVAS